jgi:hypothetical protein
VIWFACLPAGATDFGCTVDSALLEELGGVDPETATAEELAALVAAAQEAGLIGVEPLFQPSWVAPPEALDGLTEEQALEGVSAIINLSALPLDAQGYDDAEVAYKRLPISLATTPNHNPEILGMRVVELNAQGAEVGEAQVVEPWGQSLSLQKGTTYSIEPLLSDDSLETYEYRLDDGTVEERSEEPYFTWYTEGGAFDQPFTLHPYSDVAWTAPDEEWQGLVVAVIRDRRGGMNWASLTAAVQ